MNPALTSWMLMFLENETTPLSTTPPANPKTNQPCEDEELCNFFSPDLSDCNYSEMEISIQTFVPKD